MQAANTLSGAAVAAGAGDVPEPVVVAVTGSKGSGKSSVARFLVNSFLNTCTEVAFLDLDPGQPELTPPVSAVQWSEATVLRADAATSPV